MLHFFRRIRRRLLTENRLTRYLIYAFGEIVLVVIGILIALQVNNWNENRKEAEAEKRLLAALQDEFESNLELLRGERQKTLDLHAAGVRLGRLTGPEPPSVDKTELSHLLIGTFKESPGFSPNQGVLAESINSGSMSLIRNAELKRALSSWGSKIERIQTQEAYVADKNAAAIQFFLDQGNFRNHQYRIEPEQTASGAGSFPYEPGRFLGSQAFENHLYFYLATLVYLEQREYAPLETELLRIRDLIIEGQQ